jgi:predicted transcriptional regulator YheO
MALQWTDIGSSAQGTVLGVVMSLSIAGAEMSRNSTAVVYGVESRLCTSISVVASIFVVLREEAQALGIVCMFYATTLVWSIVVTLSNLMLKHTNPDQHRAEESEHPDKWFGALNRAIHEPVKFRVYANRYSSTGDGRADGSSTRKAKKKSKKGS